MATDVTVFIPEVPSTYSFDGSPQPLETEAGYEESRYWGEEVKLALTLEAAEKLCCKPESWQKLFIVLQYSGAGDYKGQELSQIPCLEVGDTYHAKHPQLEPGEPSKYEIKEKIKEDDHVAIICEQTEDHGGSLFIKNKITFEYKKVDDKFVFGVYMSQTAKPEKKQILAGAPDKVFGHEALQNCLAVVEGKQTAPTGPSSFHQPPKDDDDKKLAEETEKKFGMDNT